MSSHSRVQSAFYSLAYVTDREIEGNGEGFKESLGQDHFLERIAELIQRKKKLDNSLFSGNSND